MKLSLLKLLFFAVVLFLFGFFYVLAVKPGMFVFGT